MSRKIAFRFNLLRGGGFYARLRAVGDNAPHIRMQGDGQIKMSFSGVFSAVAEDVDGRPMEINWLADEIQPVMILDGAEHPLGVYIPTTYSVSANVRVSVSVPDSALIALNRMFGNRVAVVIIVLMILPGLVLFRMVMQEVEREALSRDKNK